MEGLPPGYYERVAVKFILLVVARELAWVAYRSLELLGLDPVRPFREAYGYSPQ